MAIPVANQARVTGEPRPGERRHPRDVALDRPLVDEADDGEDREHCQLEPQLAPRRAPPGTEQPRGENREQQVEGDLCRQAPGLFETAGQVDPIRLAEREDAQPLPKAAPAGRGQQRDDGQHPVGGQDPEGAVPQVPGGARAAPRRYQAQVGGGIRAVQQEAGQKEEERDGDVETRGQVADARAGHVQTGEEEDVEDDDGNGRDGAVAVESGEPLATLHDHLPTVAGLGGSLGTLAELGDVDRGPRHERAAQR